MNEDRKIAVAEDDDEIIKEIVENIRHGILND